MGTVGQMQGLVKASGPLGQRSSTYEQPGLRFRLDGGQDEGRVLAGAGRKSCGTGQKRGAGQVGRTGRLPLSGEARSCCCGRGARDRVPLQGQSPPLLPHRLAAHDKGQSAGIGAEDVVAARRVAFLFNAQAAHGDAQIAPNDLSKSLGLGLGHRIPPYAYDYHRNAYHL